jgi:hypothetical protein
MACSNPSSDQSPRWLAGTAAGKLAAIVVDLLLESASREKANPHPSNPNQGASNSSMGVSFGEGLAGSVGGSPLTLGRREESTVWTETGSNPTRVSFGPTIPSTTPQVVIQRFIALCRKDPLTCATSSEVPRLHQNNAPMLVSLLWGASQVLCLVPTSSAFSQLGSSARSTTPPQRSSPAPSLSPTQPLPLLQLSLAQQAAAELVAYARAVLDRLVPHLAAIHGDWQRRKADANKTGLPLFDAGEALSLVTSFGLKVSVDSKGLAVQQSQTPLSTSQVMPSTLKQSHASNNSVNSEAFLNFVKNAIPDDMTKVIPDSLPFVVLRGVAALPSPLLCPSLANRVSAVLQSFVADQRRPSGDNGGGVVLGSPQTGNTLEMNKQKAVTTVVIEAFRQVLPQSTALIVPLLNKLMLSKYVHRALVSQTSSHAEIVASMLDVLTMTTPSSRQRGECLQQLWETLSDLRRIETTDRHKAVNGAALLPILRSAIACLEQHVVELLNRAQGKTPPTASPITLGPRDSPAALSISLSAEGQNQSAILNDALMILIKCLLSTGSVTALNPDSADSSTYVQTARSMLVRSWERFLTAGRGKPNAAVEPATPTTAEGAAWEKLKEKPPTYVTVELCESWASQLILRIREPLKSHTKAATEYLTTLIALLRTLGAHSTPALTISIVSQLSDCVVDQQRTGSGLSAPSSGGSAGTPIANRSASPNPSPSDQGSRLRWQGTDYRCEILLLQLDLLLQLQSITGHSVVGIGGGAGSGNTFTDVVDAINAFCGTVTDLLEHDSRLCVTSQAQALRRSTGGPPAPGTSPSSQHLNALIQTSKMISRITCRLMNPDIDPLALANEDGAPNRSITNVITSHIREALLRRLSEACGRLAWPTSSPLQHIARGPGGAANAKRVALTTLSPFLGAIACILEGNSGNPIENFNTLWVLCVWYGFVNWGKPVTEYPTPDSMAALLYTSGDPLLPHQNVDSSSLPAIDLSGFPGGFNAALAKLASQSPPFVTFTSQSYIRTINEITALERRASAAGFEIREMQQNLTTLLSSPGITDPATAALTAKLSFAEIFVIRCCLELELLRGSQGIVFTAVSYNRYELKSFEASAELKSVIVPALSNACVSALVSSFTNSGASTSKVSEVLVPQMSLLLLDCVLGIAPIRNGAAALVIRLLSSFPYLAGEQP